MVKRKKLKKSACRFIKTLFLILFIFIGCEVLTYYIVFNKKIIPIEIHNNDYYSNSDFGINTISSEYDYDNDGIDDYNDILLGAKKYAEFNPKYVSKYYDGGYPPVEEEGVCTDLIWYALKEAGYNLKEMIILDITSDQKEESVRYGIIYRDDNIDFRRVGNQEIFFETYVKSLTTSLDNLKEFQPGDIITFENSEHIAFISDKRNANGIPYVIQNSDEEQTEKEENVLEETDMRITGHYRFTYNNEIKRLMNKVKAGT